MVNCYKLIKYEFMQFFPSCLLIYNLQSEVESVFDAMHEKEKASYDSLYDHNKFDPSEEERIHVSEMKKLLLFPDGIIPNWGENVKHWNDCDQVRITNIRTTLCFH